MRRYFLCLIYALAFTIGATAQDHNHNHDGHDHSGHNHAHTHDHGSHAHDHAHGNDAHGGDSHGHSVCGVHHPPFNAGDLAIHHIGDANVYSIGPINIPLPCILYNKNLGWSTFMSSKFDIGHHGDGHKAIDAYVLDGGSVKRVKSSDFPQGEVKVNGFVHDKDEKGKFRSRVCLSLIHI